MITDDSQSNIQGLVFREAVITGRDQGKRNALTFKMFRQKKRFPVAGAQDVKLPVFPIDPDRSHRVDHIFRRKMKSRSHSCLTRLHRSDLFPLRKHQILPCRFIDSRVRSCADFRVRIG